MPKYMFLVHLKKDRKKFVTDNNKASRMFILAIKVIYRTGLVSLGKSATESGMAITLYSDL